MKNFTNNFKQFTLRLSARWLIMALMLLVGTSSAWGAATLRYIYVGISNNYHQHKDGNNYGFNFWGGTSGGVKSGTYITTHTHDGRTYYMYRVQIHDDNNKAQFKGNKDWWDPGEGYSVTLNGTTNNAIFFSHSNDGWQGQFQNNYQETSTASLSASAASVNTNTNVTLTPSLSSNATYNQIKSTSYSVSPSGATVSNNKFTATKAGTYTVTATVTYNPKYFTGITKTATATTTITVTSTKYTVAKSETGGTGTVKVNGTTLNNSASMSSGTYDLSITAPNGYNVKSVSVTGGELTTAGPTGYSSIYSGKVNISAATTINVTYEPVCVVVNTSEIVVEVECSDGTPNIYYWGGDVTTPSWPGEDMSGSDGVFTKTFTTTKPINVIFNITKSNTTYQTVDIKDLAVGKLHRYKFDPTNGSKGDDGKFLEDKLYEDCLLPACIPVTFSWETAPVNMNYGETKNIVATLNPAEAGTVSYTASPDGIITFNDNQYTAVGKGDVTITATASLNDGYCPVSDLTKSIKVTCPTPEQPQLSIDQGITNNCDNVTNGIIAIDNYASFEGCTFTLNGNAVNPTIAGKIEDVTASGSCTVVVTNNCGNSSEPVSIDMPKTTIKAPRTDFTVSLSYPQVSFEDNKGSVYIDLSGSERNVTYYLYKDGEKVLESEKIGEGKALRWTVFESGTYTVKADNPCNGEIAMAGQVDFTCMSNLNIAFADDKTTFCPGEKTTVTITFTGTGKGDENTNPDKYGWQWTGSNYAYESVYLTESGITMPVTIDANGSIQLNVKTCNGTLSSNILNFTVVTAPEKPSVSIGQSTICRGSYTTLTVEEYNEGYTYKLYLNDALVDAPFNAGVFTISEAGRYQVTASESVCQQESAPSDPRELTLKGPSITQDKETIYPYEVVIFTSNEQVNWYLSINPSTGRELENTDPTYSGKNTAYITKAVALTTTFKGEAAIGYQISAAIGDCVTTKTFNVVADPDCE